MMDNSECACSNNLAHNSKIQLGNHRVIATSIKPNSKEESFPLEYQVARILGGVNQCLHRLQDVARIVSFSSFHQAC